MAYEHDIGECEHECGEHDIGEREHAIRTLYLDAERDIHDACSWIPSLHQRLLGVMYIPSHEYMCTCVPYM